MEKSRKSANKETTGRKRPCEGLQGKGERTMVKLVAGIGNVPHCMLKDKQAKLYFPQSQHTGVHFTLHFTGVHFTLNGSNASLGL